MSIMTVPRIRPIRATAHPLAFDIVFSSTMGKVAEWLDENEIDCGVIDHPRTELHAYRDEFGRLEWGELHQIIFYRDADAALFKMRWL